jgi:hypothetical protein
MLRFTDELDTMSARFDETLVTAVAPFINSLAPQLQTLTLWSWSTLDLSGLVRALGHFPRLSTFNLRAPFNKAFSDPAGLSALLENHAATLAAVELRLNPAGSAMDPTSEQVLGAWLLSHEARPSVLANLKLLRMYPTTLPIGFDALVMYIARSAHTLTTLAVKDRYFDLDEVAALLAPVAHRAPGEGLAALRLNVRVWNTALFDFLAGTLPELKSLTLYVGGSHPDRAAREVRTYLLLHRASALD